MPVFTVLPNGKHWLPNKKSREAQQLFENNSPGIMALAISKCREDPQMLRMLASHIIPRQKALPIKIGRLPMNTLEDLNRASGMALNKATSGKISLAEALDITAMIESRRRVLESQDLERRLSALEVTGQLSNKHRKS
jgi:hypothetical protein